MAWQPDRLLLGAGLTQRLLRKQPMLGILTSHPIQYQVPVWQALAERGNVPCRVFFLNDQGLRHQHDVGFGRSFAWDIDLCGGYDHEFLGQAGAPAGVFLSTRLGCGFGRVLRERGIRVLWIQGWQVLAYWQAVLAARHQGIPVWLRGDSNLNSSRADKLRLMRTLLLDRLFHRIDRFLYVGQGNKQLYLERGISPERLVSAPHCVDNKRFRREAEALRHRRPSLRALWGIPEDAFCFLFAGKFVSKKRPLDLVKAALRISAASPGPAIHLLFVGSGMLGDALRACCQIRFDAERATTATGGGDPTAVSASFAGFLNQSEIAKAYAVADCLVLPSEADETWGLVVNESMASGLPAIVSDAVGCAPDLVQPHWPDLCFPVGDVEALARSMAVCIKGPPSPEEIASVIADYDVMVTVEAVERLYNGRTVGRRVIL